MPQPTEAEQDTIDEFQAKRREFQPRWTRNIGILFLPGMLLLMVGGGMVEELLHGTEVRPNLWLFIPGVALCAAGLARGVWLMHHYLRCPLCNALQTPAWQFPYRSCQDCGARLSVGYKDSR